MITNKSVATSSHPHVALGMLLIVYIFNYVDRQILSILAAPIQADLNLSDTQMGLLGGLAFALLYSTMAVPLAWIADRTGRSRVIAISLAVWSCFTALTGLAQNFWHIFFARLGVGVGEAGGVAPSHALISDYFPSEQRSRALSIHSLGIPLGSAAGVLLGGYIAAKVDWRLAFFVVGIAGVLLAPMFKLLVKDPQKAIAADIAASNSVNDTAPVEPIKFIEVIRLLAAKRSFWFLSLGMSAGSMFGYGLVFWLPSLLQRSFDLSLQETSYFFGALLLIGGVFGILIGGWLGDKLGRKNQAAYALIPAAAALLSVPLFAAGIMSSSAFIAFFILLLPQALTYVGIGPILSAVQHLVDAPARSTASALFLLVVNLLGLAGGIYFLGALSDFLAPTFGQDSLKYSILFALGLNLLAGVLMILAAPSLKLDWVEG